MGGVAVKDMPATFEEWFWGYVDFDVHDTNRCWRWKGSKTKGNYGNGHAPSSLTGVYPRFDFQAHKMAWVLEFGEWPKGMESDHKCHDPEFCQLRNNCPHRLCCNPWHVVPSTHVENIRNSGVAVWTPSERIPTKLDMDKALEIRTRHVDGRPLRYLAEEFGVSIATISLVVNHKIWNR